MFCYLQFYHSVYTFIFEHLWIWASPHFWLPRAVGGVWSQEDCCQELLHGFTRVDNSLKNLKDEWGRIKEGRKHTSREQHKIDRNDKVLWSTKISLNVWCSGLFFRSRPTLLVLWTALCFKEVLKLLTVPPWHDREESMLSSSHDGGYPDLGEDGVFLPG